ncbi:hypothetical protein [Sneathiella sp.]|uniref:hypothetical protein n=1 Tax=Sneathiella sp. TaxID=1964365 RepID=UPI00260CC6C7|nr:hypothetical protein [Sneathiella sp.]MDF2365629.1 hypothetical protein [Sneathiella sp.]
MKKEIGKYQRPSTRFSKSGRTVTVTLHVDRRDYEFARAWAEFHSPAAPAGTAECQLEGYLSMALCSHRLKINWEPPADIQKLYEGSDTHKPGWKHGPDDGTPF